MIKEIYHHQTTSIDRSTSLMRDGFNVTYYRDMDGGRRCWVVEYKR